MSRKESSKKKYVRSLIAKFVLSATLLPVIMYFFPSAVPFRFFEFWHIQGSLFQWIFSAWPIFAWGMSVTILNGVFTHNDPDLNRDAEMIIIVGSIISCIHGVAEEILYRWLFFLLDIILVKVGNFI